LDEYDGNLSDLLRGILQECGYETRIPVKNYAYYEGRVFQKYKVGIMLPAKLGMSMVMPAVGGMTPGRVKRLERYMECG
jgi:hypothetical protein